MSHPCNVLTLRVELLDVDPPTWREIDVDHDITLRDLHHILQAAFGWESAHPYSFASELSVWRNLDRKPHPPCAQPFQQFNDRRMQLSAMAWLGSVILYRYGALGGWRHRIEVIGADAYHEELGRAYVCQAEGVCPLEECDSPSDWMQLLAALDKRDGSPEHKAALDAISRRGPIDLECPDVRAINAALSRLAMASNQARMA